MNVWMNEQKDDCVDELMDGSMDGGGTDRILGFKGRRRQARSGAGREGRL